MKNVLSLKMLGVLAVVLLVSSMNEGRIVGKCELKAQLAAAFGANMTGNATQAGPANMTGNVTQPTPGNATGNLTQSVPRNMTGNTTGDLIARLVCAVERTSRFNTSLISTIQFPPQNPPKPNGPHQKPGGKPDDANKERDDANRDRDDSNRDRDDSNRNRDDSNRNRDDSNRNRDDSNRNRDDSNRNRDDSNWGRPGGKPGDSKPGNKPRGKRSPPRAPGGGRDKPPTGSSGVPSGTAMNLFGIFQLSDRVACNSGSNQTLNICRMNCTALIDDNIRDDIACLKTMLGYMKNVTTTPPPSAPPKVDVMFVEECRSVVPSQYFALC